MTADEAHQKNQIKDAQNRAEMLRKAKSADNMLSKIEDKNNIQHIIAAAREELRGLIQSLM